MTGTIGERIAGLDWPRMQVDIGMRGWTTTGEILTRTESETLAGYYNDDIHFRSRVVMSRHGFGRGEYRYFSYPLPDLVAGLRQELYGRLVGIAESWRVPLGGGEPFPLEHRDYLARCNSAGQKRPTPLLLRYGPGDYNCLHQDLYGDHVFPPAGGIPAVAATDGV